MNKVEKMYEAIHEVVCAFVLHQEAIEKARESKKSVMKAYNEMNEDLARAFRICLDTIEEIKDTDPKDIQSFLKKTADFYSYEYDLRKDYIEELEKEKENASTLKKKYIDAKLKSCREDMSCFLSAKTKAFMILENV